MKCLILYRTTVGKKTSQNIEGKGENAGNQHFLLFPQCFVPFVEQFSFSETRFFLFSSANALNLDQSEILPFGKEINP